MWCTSPARSPCDPPIAWWNLHRASLRALPRPGTRSWHGQPHHAHAKRPGPRESRRAVDLGATGLRAAPSLAGITVPRAGSRRAGDDAPGPGLACGEVVAARDRGDACRAWSPISRWPPVHAEQDRGDARARAAAEHATDRLAARSLVQGLVVQPLELVELLIGELRVIQHGRCRRGRDLELLRRFRVARVA